MRKLLVIGRAADGFPLGAGKFIEALLLFCLFACASAGAAGADNLGGYGWKKGFRKTTPSWTPNECCRRAEAARGKKDYNGAIAKYTEAVSLDPSGSCSTGKAGSVYNSRGELYVLKGDYAAAIADFTKAVELDRYNAEAFANRGDANAIKGNNGQAVEDYDAALGLDPGHRRAAAGRRKAAAALERSLAGEMAKSRGQAAGLVSKGRACYYSDDYSGAILNWNKAVSLDPETYTELKPLLIKAYGRRGAIYFREKDYDRTIADFDEVLKLAPELDDVRRARELALQARREKGGRGKVVSAGNLLTAPAALLQAQMAAANNPGSPYGAQLPSPGTQGAFPAPGSPLSAPAGSPWTPRTGGDREPEEGGGPSGTTLKKLSGALAWVIALLFVSLALMLRRAGAGAAASGLDRLGRATRATARGASDWWLGLIKKGLSVPPSDAFVPVKKEQPGPAASVSTLMSEGRYDEACAQLAKKKVLEIADYEVFLRVYVRRKDFVRARLTISQLSQLLRGRPGYDHSLYLSLADECSSAGQQELARQLRRIAVDGILKSVDPKQAPALFYDLAATMERDGEHRLARRLFQALSALEKPYRDSAARFKQLAERPVTRTGVPRSAPPPRAAPGPAFILGRYEVRNKIGEGEMGVIFEAWDRQRGRKVALKKMRSWLKKYPEEYKRFINEAKIVRRLQHPNIVAVQAIAEQGDDVYLVFDFVAGRPLSSIISFNYPVPLARCREIFHDVCEAVHYAHANNVMHRDLKPDNILLDGKDRALVADFGLASVLREGQTRVSRETTSGTPFYMAPEQHGGIVRKESDIFALGVCLYETLTGVRPYVDDCDLPKAKLDREYKEITSVLPWLPAGADKLMARALEPDPSQRFADALELYEALKKL